MRGRIYDPRTGRFLSPDPNRTGLAMCGNVLFHGARPYLATPQLSALSLLGDGMNLYQSRGGNPAMFGDEPGLFFSLVGVSLGTTTMTELEQDWSEEVAQTGMSLMDTLYYALADAGDAQWMMAELAGDWDAPDELFDAEMTAGGGVTMEFGGKPRPKQDFDLSELFVPLFLEFAGTENDHMIPVFSGGPDDKENMFRLITAQHRGAGGRSRHGNLRAMMRNAGIPLTSGQMSGKKWQIMMRGMAKNDPGVVESWHNALRANAKHVGTEYAERMEKAIKKWPRPWDLPGVGRRRR
jgi:hypothetical protein